MLRQRVVYLVATLWDCANLRQFALRRFDQATAMNSDTTLPDGFELDAYIHGGAFAYPNAGTDRVSLELRMSAAVASHLHETPLSEDQIITEDPDDADWGRVTAAPQKTEQLYWWLLGFGANVEVLALEHLRSRMIASTRELVAHYSLDADDSL